MAQLIPAILTNNLKDYKNKILTLEKIVPRVQIDVIDGQFASNTTIGIKEIISVKTSLFLETHLMVSDPEKYIEDCAKADIKLITVHLEACKNNIGDILDKIHSFGIKAGVAINPETPIESTKPLTNKLDLILIMGVHPGFGGQKFIPETLEKIKALRKISPTIPIEVDGGINKENIKEIAKAGADYLVIGSSLFKNGTDGTSVKKRAEELNKEITSSEQIAS